MINLVYPVEYNYREIFTFLVYLIHFFVILSRLVPLGQRFPTGLVRVAFFAGTLLAGNFFVFIISFFLGYMTIFFFGYMTIFFFGFTACLTQPSLSARHALAVSTSCMQDQWAQAQGPVGPIWAQGPFQDSRGHLVLGGPIETSIPTENIIFS